MTRFKRIATATLAALTLATTLAATSVEARPRYWGHRGGWGAGAGIVGALAVGGLIAAAASRPAYGGGGYYGGRSCEMVERINRYGEVVGYRRVCGYY